MVSRLATKSNLRHEYILDICTLKENIDFLIIREIGKITVRIELTPIM